MFQKFPEQPFSFLLLFGATCGLINKADEIPYRLTHMIIVSDNDILGSSDIDCFVLHELHL